MSRKRGRSWGNPWLEPDPETSWQRLLKDVNASIDDLLVRSPTWPSTPASRLGGGGLVNGGNNPVHTWCSVRSD